MRRKEIVYVVLLAAIAKHLLSNEYGPFDRLVELAVCALILYEVIVGIRERRRTKRRIRWMEQGHAAMSAAMLKGQELQSTFPKMIDTHRGEWVVAVETWTTSTRGLLKSYSAKAETLFLLDTRDRTVNYTGGAPDQQAWLAARLKNLRGIMEKPDVYLSGGLRLLLVAAFQWH